jgi:DNA-binding XRE family transcriptional regulator
MSDDFKNLIEAIEAEAKAEGTAAEAELREQRREFSIASQLMTLRREKKLTQKQLAKASGIPQSEISRIETGDANPTYATLSALAEPFGVRVGFIRPDIA